MNKPRNQPIARVELVIRGEQLITSDITNILAISPTRSFAKGDIVSKRNVEHKRPWGLWALEFVGMEVQDAAIQLLETLRGKEETLRKLAADMPDLQVSIAIWWDPPEGQGGFTLSSATLAELCATSLQIHFYLPG